MGSPWRENQYPPVPSFWCTAYRAGGNHEPLAGFPIMNDLQAFYTPDHKVYVSFYSTIKGRTVQATFADIHEVREMLPLPMAQKIEAQLTVNDMIKP